MTETGEAPGAARPTVTEVHAQHTDFVWQSLHRLGVRAADVPDMLQEVFVVVHRRLDTYDGRSRLTTWLFGICLRVAAAYRRRAHVRRERLTDRVPETAEQGDTPEDAALAVDARARLAAALDALDLDKRAVLVMFELEEMGCGEIAELLGVPVGTVHSRLHSARSSFKKALARHDARRAARHSSAARSRADSEPPRSPFRLPALPSTEARAAPRRGEA